MKKFLLSALAVLTLASAAFAPELIAQIGGGGISAGSGGTQVQVGTFTVTWQQACTTDPTQTWNYVMIGDLVMLVPTQEVSCTSDSTSFISAAGALPVAIRQNTASVVMMAGGLRAQDNTVDVEACLRIESDFSLALSRTTAGFCTTANNWTAAGTKQMFGTTNPSVNNFMYSKDRT